MTSTQHSFAWGKLFYLFRYNQFRLWLGPVHSIPLLVESFFTCSDTINSDYGLDQYTVFLCLWKAFLLVPIQSIPIMAWTSTQYSFACGKLFYLFRYNQFRLWLGPVHSIPLLVESFFTCSDKINSDYGLDQYTLFLCLWKAFLLVPMQSIPIKVWTSTLHSFACGDFFYFFRYSQFRLWFGPVHSIPLLVETFFP